MDALQKGIVSTLAPPDIFHLSALLSQTTQPAAQLPTPLFRTWGRWDSPTLASMARSSQEDACLAASVGGSGETKPPSDGTEPPGPNMPLSGSAMHKQTVSGMSWSARSLRPGSGPYSPAHTARPCAHGSACFKERLESERGWTTCR